MTVDERKDKIKQMWDELSALPEEDRFIEFASLVYAKCAVRQIIDNLKSTCSGPEELAEKVKDSELLGTVVSAVATYGTMGMEIGYASMKGDDDVSE